MDSDPKNTLHAIRMMGMTYEKWITGSIGDGLQQVLSDEDVKYVSLVALMMMTELKNALDTYETKGANEWMSVAEAVAKAKCSRRTVCRAIKDGELRSKKENGRRVIERQSLDKFAYYRGLFTK